MLISCKRARVMTRWAKVELVHTYLSDALCPLPSLFAVSTRGFFPARAVVSEAGLFPDCLVDTLLDLTLRVGGASESTVPPLPSTLTEPNFSPVLWALPSAGVSLGNKLCFAPRNPPWCP